MMVEPRCQGAGCDRAGVPLTRGYCRRCYQRWRRAGAPPEGVPPRRKLPLSDPAHPTHCPCGELLGPRDGRTCEACRQYKWRHGVLRTPAIRAALIARRLRPRLCRDCGRPLAYGTRCHRCVNWPARHGGLAYPAGGTYPLRAGPVVPAGWTPIVGLGLVPPAGYCAPGESYGQVVGCTACGYRRECQELSAVAVAS